MYVNAYLVCSNGQRTLSGNETENRQFSIVIELRSVEGIGFRESIREVLQRKNIRDFFRKYTVEE